MQTALQMDKNLKVKASIKATGILYSVLVPAIQKRCGQAEEDPGKGHKDDARTGKPAM